MTMFLERAHRRTRTEKRSSAYSGRAWKACAQASIETKISLCFLCGHMRATEGFRAVSDQDQRFSSDIGDLVIILGAEKYDLVFLDHPLIAFDSLDRCLALQDEKSLGRQVIVHIGVFAGAKVKYPGAKRFSSKQRDKTFIFGIR